MTKPSLCNSVLRLFVGALATLLLVPESAFAQPAKLKDEMRLPWQRPLAFVLGGILLVEAIYLILFRTGPATEAVAIPAGFGAPAGIGALLFNTYLLPFEVISILLLAAMVGAIVLTKKQKQNG